MLKHTKFIIQVVGNRYLEGRIVECIANGEPGNALVVLNMLIALAVDGKVAGKHSYSQLLDAAERYCEKNELTEWQTKALLGVAFWAKTSELHHVRMLLTDEITRLDLAAKELVAASS